MTRTIAAALALVMCAGCAALDIDVEKSPGSCVGSGDCQTRDLEGFPFNVKVPQRVQTTKIAVPVIVIEVKESERGAPLAAPIEMQGLQHLDDVIKSVNEARSGKGLDHMRSQLQALVATELAPRANGDVAVPMPAGARTVANTITVEAVLSDKQHYFSPTMPIAGSSSATVKPGQDGTFSEVTVNVTDKTLEVLPNLIPLKDILLRSTTPGTRDKSGKRKAGPTVVVSLATEIHTLKTVLPAGVLNAPPLMLDQVKAGTAQLLSVERVGAAAASEGPPKPAYSITGKITLPDPPK